MSDVDRAEYMGVHLSTGPGWDDLVKPLVKFVLENGGTVDQIKEKFGGLRFYYSKPGSMFETHQEELEQLWGAFEERVQEAEAASIRTCEFTGKPGKPMNKGGYGWVKTVSEEYAAEHGYVNDLTKVLYPTREDLEKLMEGD
jgi:hypothetical protein